MSFNKETGMYEGYLYKITNNINGKIYIGQTIVTIQRRWNQHKTNANKENPDMAISRAIKKYGHENFTIEELMVFECCTLDELKESLNELEIMFINRFNSLIDKNGYNIDKGGSSASACMQTVKVFNIDGKLLEMCDSAMDVSRKYNLSDVTVRLICKGLQPNYNNTFVFRYEDDSFDKFNVFSNKNKPIYQFKKTGEFVKRYDMTIHAEKEIGQGIRKEAIDNPHLLSGGYWWSYGDIFNYLGSSVKRKIDVYDKNEQFVATYESIVETSRITGVDTNAIVKCCNHQAKVRKGYMFCYHGENLSDNTFTPSSIRNHRAVNQYSKKTNEYIHTFESETAATRAMTSKSSIAIHNCCNHKKHYNTAFGYKWFFADDPNQPDKSKIVTNYQEETKVS